MLQIHKQDEWDNFIFSLFLDPNQSSISKLNKCLLSKWPIVHPIAGPISPVYLAVEESELFVDSLKRQFILNPGSELTKVSAVVQMIRSTSTPKLNFFITPGTIQKFISRLLKKKSSVWRQNYKYCAQIFFEKHSYCPHQNSERLS